MSYQVGEYVQARYRRGRIDQISENGLEFYIDYPDKSKEYCNSWELQTLNGQFIDHGLEEGDFVINHNNSTVSKVIKIIPKDEINKVGGFIIENHQGKVFLMPNEVHKTDNAVTYYPGDKVLITPTDNFSRANSYKNHIGIADMAKPAFSGHIFVRIFTQGGTKLLGLLTYDITKLSDDELYLPGDVGIYRNVPVKIILDRNGVCKIWGHGIENGESFYASRSMITLISRGNVFKCDCEHCDNAGESYLEGFGFVCSDCLESNSYECHNCGCIVSVKDDYYNDNSGEPICSSCYNNYYRCCDDCGGLFHEEDLEDGLCERCQENRAVCTRCGNTFYDRDDHSVCPDCIKNAIHCYSYKPYPQFYGNPDNNKYLGIEWEIGDGGNDPINALDILDDQPEVYAKEDNSVDNGFEVVTHPMSADYHLNEFDWQGTMRRARNLGYEGIAFTGIHIHVSRACLTDRGIANLIWFFERQWNNIFDFSRRELEEVESFTDRYLRDRDILYYTPDQVLNMAENTSSRYHAVNIKPMHTVEIRIFRSTIYYGVMMSYIQFTDIITDLCMDDNIGETFTFNHIVEEAQVRGYTELVKYIRHYCCI